MAREAGIPSGLAPHGLRKARCRPLAEAGATTHQIAAVTGHKNLKEVETYTRAAEQARMAAQGMDRIGGGASNLALLELPTRLKIGG
ncbi:tyrosine-type recombinase/integrase [Neoroseomonas terrae]|uniref:tyrosine-type recombinase/integrase n=1 Tax=Neoroseomonas terrae TaxID=424799 RepID=UPI0030B9EB4F